MALTCPVEFDVATLRGEIQTMYGVATAPDLEFHFHRGPAYAASRLRYDHAELAQLPVAVTSSFAGVGNPHAIAPIDLSAVVLDIGRIRFLCRNNERTNRQTVRVVGVNLTATRS